MTERTLKQLVYDLRNDFKIDDYLELRQRFPSREFYWDIFRSGFPECDSAAFFVATGQTHVSVIFEECEAFDIDVEYYYGAVSGSYDAIDRLCLQILAALSKRSKGVGGAAHLVANGLAIGDALVSFLISAITASLGCHNLKIPPSFQILLAHHLGVSSGKYKDSLSNRDALLSRAFIELSNNPNMGVREFARALNIDPSSASRLLKDGRLRQEAAIAHDQIMQNKKYHEECGWPDNPDLD